MGLFSSRTSIFNTLCELFDIKFFHQDHYYSFEYDSGALVGSFYGGDSAEYLDSVEHEETDADSSEVKIKFDKNIFKDCFFDYDWINQEIRDRATRSDIEIIVNEHKPKPDTRLKEKPPHDNWDVPAEWQEVWSQLEFDEFSHDLVAWKPTKRRMIGGLRLILPKNGRQSFFVSSGECASERWGVSAYYEMKFKIAGNLIVISKIVSEFTGLNPVAIYKLAKNLGTSDVVYIGEPVEMLNRVKTEGGTIELYRPDDKGGYF